MKERKEGDSTSETSCMNMMEQRKRKRERLSIKKTRAEVDATISAQNTSQRAQSGGRSELKLQSSLDHNDRRSSSGKKITATNDSRIIVQALRAEENVSNQHSGRSQSEASNEAELQPSHDHNADERTGKRPSGEVTGVIDDSSAISPRLSAENMSKKSSQRPQSGEHSLDPKYVKTTGKRSKRKRKKYFTQESLNAENTSKKVKKSSEGSNLLGTQINQEEEEMIPTPEVLSQELKNHIKGIMPQLEKTTDDYSRLRKNANLNLLATAAEAEGMKAGEEEKERRLRRNLSTFLKLLQEKEAEKSSKKHCSKPRFHEKDDGNDDGFPKRMRSPFNQGNNSANQEEIHQQKKVKKTHNFLNGPVTSLPKNSGIIPDEFKNRIKELGGSESSISFVCEKVLTDADVSRLHARILIPFKQVKNEFFTHEEDDCFQDPVQKTEIDAVLIGPSLDESRINLRRWLVHKDNMSLNYALINHWGHVVKKNKLGSGMTVQWWSFKKGSQLGFALTNL